MSTLKLLRHLQRTVVDTTRFGIRLPMLPMSAKWIARDRSTKAVGHGLCVAEAIMAIRERRVQAINGTSDKRSRKRTTAEKKSQLRLERPHNRPVTAKRTSICDQRAPEKTEDSRPKQTVSSPSSDVPPSNSSRPAPVWGSWVARMNAPTPTTSTTPYPAFMQSVAYQAECAKGGATTASHVAAEVRRPTPGAANADSGSLGDVGANVSGASSRSRSIEVAAAGGSASQPVPQGHTAPDDGEDGALETLLPQALVPVTLHPRTGEPLAYLPASSSNAYASRLAAGAFLSLSDIASAPYAPGPVQVLLDVIRARRAVFSENGVGLGAQSCAVSASNVADLLEGRFLMLAQQAVREYEETHDKDSEALRDQLYGQVKVLDAHIFCAATVGGRVSQTTSSGQLESIPDIFNLRAALLPESLETAVSAAVSERENERTFSATAERLISQWGVRAAAYAQILIDYVKLSALFEKEAPPVNGFNAAEPLSAIGAFELLELELAVFVSFRQRLRAADDATTSAIGEELDRCADVYRRGIQEGLLGVARAHASSFPIAFAAVTRTLQASEGYHHEHGELASNPAALSAPGLSRAPVPPPSQLLSKDLLSSLADSVADRNSLTVFRQFFANSSQSGVLVNVGVSTELYTAIIRACSRSKDEPNRLDIALSLFRALKDHDLAPSVDTYTAMMLTAASVGQPTRAFALYHECKQTFGQLHGFPPDFFAALLLSYVSAGHKQDAWLTWSVLEEAGVSPNRTLLHAVLAAAPDADAGLDLIRRATADTRFGISATPATFAFVVQLVVDAKFVKGVYRILALYDVFSLVLRTLAGRHPTLESLTSGKEEHQRAPARRDDDGKPSRHDESSGATGDEGEPDGVQRKKLKATDDDTNDRGRLDDSETATFLRAVERGLFRAYAPPGVLGRPTRDRAVEDETQRLVAARRPSDDVTEEEDRKSAAENRRTVHPSTTPTTSTTTGAAAAPIPAASPEVLSPHERQHALLSSYIRAMARPCQRLMTSAVTGGITPQRPTMVPYGSEVAVLCGDLLSTDLDEVLARFADVFTVIVIPYSAQMYHRNKLERLKNGVLIEARSDVPDGRRENGFAAAQEEVGGDDDDDDHDAAAAAVHKRLLHSTMMAESNPPAADKSSADDGGGGATRDALLHRPESVQHLTERWRTWLQRHREVVHLVGLEEELLLSPELRRLAIRPLDLLARSAAFGLSLVADPGKMRVDLEPEMLEQTAGMYLRAHARVTVLSLHRPTITMMATHPFVRDVNRVHRERLDLDMLHVGAIGQQGGGDRRVGNDSKVVSFLHVEQAAHRGPWWGGPGGGIKPQTLSSLVLPRTPSAQPPESREGKVDVMKAATASSAQRRSEKGDRLEGRAIGGKRRVPPPSPAKEEGVLSDSLMLDLMMAT